MMLSRIFSPIDRNHGDDRVFEATGENTVSRHDDDDLRTKE